MSGKLHLVLQQTKEDLQCKARISSLPLYLLNGKVRRQNDDYVRLSQHGGVLFSHVWDYLSARSANSSNEYVHISEAHHILCKAGLAPRLLNHDNVSLYCTSHIMCINQVFRDRRQSPFRSQHWWIWQYKAAREMRCGWLLRLIHPLPLLPPPLPLTPPPWWRLHFTDSENKVKGNERSGKYFLGIIN